MYFLFKILFYYWYVILFRYLKNMHLIIYLLGLLVDFMQGWVLDYENTEQRSPSRFLLSTINIYQGYRLNNLKIYL